MSTTDAPNVPPCHSRRLLESRNDLFFCAHPRMHAKNNLVTPGVCWTCTYHAEPPPAVFREFVPGQTVVEHKGNCAYLGAELGLRDCPGCRGTVRLKVFACGHPAHGETTLRDCLACPDFKPLSS